jgi:NitT/TauT family transport system permease protein
MAILTLQSAEANFTDGRMRKRRIDWDRAKESAARILPPLVAFILFIGIWQFGLQAFEVPAYLFPKPTDIVSAASDNWVSLIRSVLTTTLESVMGFLLSIVLGSGAAILMASSKIIERAMVPYAIILQTIPVVAIAPIVVIWFGAGWNAIVIISFLIGFFPMLSNTLIGLNSTDQNQKQLFTLYNAGGWQRMWRLRIPAALPYIIAGLRVSCSLSVVGSIVGEYCAGVGGGRGGLGYAITYAAARIQTPYLFACGLSSSALGIIFYLLVRAVSNRLLSSWHESEMKVES